MSDVELGERRHAQPWLSVMPSEERERNVSVVRGVSRLLLDPASHRYDVWCMVLELPEVGRLIIGLCACCARYLGVDFVSASFIEKLLGPHWILKCVV